jgi:hypothetical protein
MDVFSRLVKRGIACPLGRRRAQNRLRSALNRLDTKTRFRPSGRDATLIAPMR